MEKLHARSILILHSLPKINGALLIDNLHRNEDSRRKSGENVTKITRAYPTALAEKSINQL